MELEVLERVILGADRQAVVLRIGRDAVRDRPRREHPVVLEAQIPMQPRGVMLLDDEPMPIVRGVSRAGRLRRRVEVALGAIARELVRVLGSWHLR